MLHENNDYVWGKYFVRVTESNGRISAHEFQTAGAIVSPTPMRLAL